jgi:hypothetical protein
MKAYEFPVLVTTEGQLDIPPAYATVLPKGEMVRVIVLVNELSDIQEDEDWSRLTAEQFLAGYSDADSIYDSLS